MAAPGDDLIPVDRISLADTRPALPLGVPFAFLPVAIFLPAIMVVVTYNIFWLLLMPVLLGIGRALVAKDRNYPRLLWLRWKSGSLFANHSQHGGELVVPILETSKWDGINPDVKDSK